ncbi:putative deferrochelatase/peroxidase EfeN precursor [Arthrobacter saudimassiliensis]|uniref:Putative deferrochelatase/peroxidase EfeN n=1 Tax=Arthrobacter saudimassiliensis TaxID=1461584 RepID=A0A078MRW1_9MICC|nr:putative deferrochelatase/peroxidase EfeN precursor [Arthrobacter saudimassiliensis]
MRRFRRASGSSRRTDPGHTDPGREAPGRKDPGREQPEDPRERPDADPGARGAAPGTAGAAVPAGAAPPADAGGRAEAAGVRSDAPAPAGSAGREPGPAAATPAVPAGAAVPAAPRPRSGVGRRHLLAGGAAAGLGALAAAGAQIASGRTTPERATAPDDGGNGLQTVPFHGLHQAGIETPEQAHAVFLGLDLLPSVTRDRLQALLRLLSDDAAALTQGRPALADTEPELALRPARLTVTFGFGPNLLERANPGLAPSWLRPLPAFGIDRLQPEFGAADLLLAVAADDPLTVAHARRMLLKDSRAFATLRWTQSGFRRSYGTEAAGTTMRNLFGQVDGTANPRAGSEDFTRVVWGDADIPAWLPGGTSVVIRRIAMNVDTWDELDRPAREESVGRRLDSGAPLTGTREDDEPDFQARSSLGFPVIPEYSHMRRARPEDPRQRIYRRSYNYDEPAAAGGAGGSVSDAGQIFVSYQADVDRQFVPIQRRLDELDILNEWTVPIGSAVFAVPPGAREGGFVGEELFS